MKYGLTKSLTADFTYNTDFAQVEADEPQVNLTRFTRFPEKREFFLEDRASSRSARLRRRRRRLDAPTIFYSRRIGLAGRARAGDRRRARGRQGGPWSIGALNMETTRTSSARRAADEFHRPAAAPQYPRPEQRRGHLHDRRCLDGRAGREQVSGLDRNFAFWRKRLLQRYVESRPRAERRSREAATT